MNPESQDVPQSSQDTRVTQSSAPIDKEAEFEAWSQIANALKKLGPEAQARVLKSVITLLEIDFAFVRREEAASLQSSKNKSIEGGYSENRQLSPKEFLLEKRPMSDVDRVACLAYYLTHYQNTPHFKTLDLSKLNTDAAQIKLSNPAQAVDNATKSGLLATASKGNKQLSAIGEIYVQALPDKAAARAAIEAHRTPRRGRRLAEKNSDENRAN